MVDAILAERKKIGGPWLPFWRASSKDIPNQPSQEDKQKNGKGSRTPEIDDATTRAMAEMQKFYDQYELMGLDQYEKEHRLIVRRAEQLEAFAEKAGTIEQDRVAIAKWATDQIAQTRKAEGAAKESILKDFEQKHSEATLSTEAFIRQQVERQAEIFLEAGVDRIKVEEWVQAEIKK